MYVCLDQLPFVLLMPGALVSKKVTTACLYTGSESPSIHGGKTRGDLEQLCRVLVLPPPVIYRKPGQGGNRNWRRTVHDHYTAGRRSRDRSDFSSLFSLPEPPLVLLDLLLDNLVDPGLLLQLLLVDAELAAGPARPAAAVGGPGRGSCMGNEIGGLNST